MPRNQMLLDNEHRFHGTGKLLWWVLLRSEGMRPDAAWKEAS